MYNKCSNITNKAFCLISLHHIFTDFMRVRLVLNITFYFTVHARSKSIVIQVFLFSPIFTHSEHSSEIKVTVICLSVVASSGLKVGKIGLQWNPS